MIIETHKIRKEYDTLVAVNNVDLTISEGEIYGLIGPNGAGKTTLMRMICGLLEPTKGDILINGVNVWKKNLDANAYMSFLPDFFSCYGKLYVWEYLDYFANAYKLDKNGIPDRIDQVLSLVNLMDKKNSFVETLSRGMKQRLGIAKSIIHNPKLLVLDEPASGLDPIARTELSNLLVTLKKRGITILVSSHILSELADFCTSVGIMENGRLVKSGNIKELVAKSNITKKIILQTTGYMDITKKYLARKKSIRNIEDLDKNRIRFEFSGTDADLAKLNRELIVKKVPVSGIIQETEGIKEIFNEVVKEEKNK